MKPVQTEQEEKTPNGLGLSSAYLPVTDEKKTIRLGEGRKRMMILARKGADLAHGPEVSARGEKKGRPARKKKIERFCSCHRQTPALRRDVSKLKEDGNQGGGG